MPRENTDDSETKQERESEKKLIHAPPDLCVIPAPDPDDDDVIVLNRTERDRNA